MLLPDKSLLSRIGAELLRRIPPLPFGSRLIQLRQPNFIDLLSRHTAAEFSGVLPILDQLCIRHLREFSADLLHFFHLESAGEFVSDLGDCLIRKTELQRLSSHLDPRAKGIPVGVL
jgi:hypothetical protein